MAFPGDRDFPEAGLIFRTQEAGESQKADFDDVIQTGETFHHLSKVEGSPLPDLEDADNSFDGHNCSSEEVEQEKDLHQADSPPADEPPQKKPRVSLSQPKSNERALSNEIKIPSLGIPCEDRCAKKCTLNISHERRKTIFDTYWSMSRHEQRLWVFSRVSRDLKHRDTTGPGHISRRSMTYSYHFKADNGTSHEVCKTFFLATLGYHPKNDRFITTAMRSTSLESVVSAVDRRGRHVPSNKLDTNPIKAHIESFGPTSSHYTCEHGPQMRYLPSTITIRFMFQDFKDKNPGTKCSYETYRKVVRELKINFAKLGEEECENCSNIEIHSRVSDNEQTIQSQTGSSDQRRLDDQTTSV